MSRPISISKVTRGVCSIQINRPQKRNALDSDAIASLKDTMSEFEANPDYKIAILSGVGGNFCAGYDLNQIVDSRTCMPNLNNIRQILWPLGARLSDKKVIIAAIDGHAAGFGFELALKCDFRVADKSARMGFMNRRFGIPIMNGGTVILPQLVGYSQAAELIATGKAQPADEALRSGVIHYVSDIGCSVGRALNLARCLEKFDQPALLNDLKGIQLTRFNNEGVDLFKRERDHAIKLLETCAPLEVAGKFLDGKLCRHGNYDLGNLIKPEPEVTL